jgi:hypothetical protein
MPACMSGERCEALPRVPPNPAVNRTRTGIRLRSCGHQRGPPVSLNR